MSDLIWIQTDSLIVFLKDFFFQKSSDKKSLQNYTACKELTYAYIFNCSQYFEQPLSEHLNMYHAMSRHHDFNIQSGIHHAQPEC